MYYRVSQEKVDAVLEDLRKHVPNFQIVYKDEPMPTWWLKALFQLIAWIGIILPNVNKRWLEDISNGIGRWIIFPTREGYSDLRKYSVYVTLRHESVHLKDMAKNPLHFILTYGILPLPFYRSGRAHWEFRGYAQNLIVEYEEFGKISDDNVAWVKKQFTAPTYLWMDMRRELVSEKVNTLRSDIVKGKVSGRFPDISW